MKEDQLSSSASSLENALQLLKMFTMDEPELRLSEIAEKLGVAASTAHRLVNTLVAEGFVVKDPRTNMYRLGASILAFGKMITAQIKLYREALPILQELVNKSNETAHIGILDQTDTVYLHKIECSHPVRLLSHSGKRNPAYCTGTGQLILAYQDERTVNRVIERGLVRKTPKTITRPDEFLSLLNTIRKQGFAIASEQLHEGVTSIAAPIRDLSGQVVASVAVVGPVQRITTARIRPLTHLVVQAGHEISERMGCKSIFETRI
ncbi:IclR family transcriptional regulator [Ferviditalea candida]|uniref:IclR family transcriptional regulator n=1 Tax=Ferviditalea candida TaxID=3108399 RepID=A0ABU5ZI24_9BACL|nr:IclR family transcriptional regulator [Paenibacillaceae bacterium T2]